jgi:uncharacterized protein YbjT (DUF2867 family)
MRIVVLGGSGNFGARICRALRTDAGIDVISAGRHVRQPADPEGIATVSLDIEGAGLTKSLKALGAELVIHCVGPYQGQDYRIAQAALRSGAHYLDLADGRAFVAGFRAANHEQARVMDRLAISGASTLPALSSAVLDELALRVQPIESIEVVIAPGQRAPRGAATLKAVFSYLGRPFNWLHDGTWTEVYGWQELKRIHLDCGTRWAAACDVPDLELLPQRFPTAVSVEFRAALEFGVQHVALWILASLRRRGAPIPIERWSAGLDRIASLLNRFGGEYGGMLVSIVGMREDGTRRRLCWHLTAPAKNGPEVPCMAAILLARRLARGQLGERGAYPCMGFLTLRDFEPELARWGIRSRLEEKAA